MTSYIFIFYAQPFYLVKKANFIVWIGSSNDTVVSGNFVPLFWFSYSTILTIRQIRSQMELDVEPFKGKRSHP